MEGLHEMMDFMDAFTLSPSAERGLRLGCSARLARPEPSLSRPSDPVIPDRFLHHVRHAHAARPIHADGHNSGGMGRPPCAAETFLAICNRC